MNIYTIYLKIKNRIQFIIDRLLLLSVPTIFFIALLPMQANAVHSDRQHNWDNKQNHNQSQLDSSDIFEQAMAILPSNPSQARKYLALASRKGHPAARYEYAKLLKYGIGGPQNEPEALYWYRLSAQDGYREAQSELGHLLLQHKNRLAHQEAISILTKAAYQGDVRSQQTLGKLYTGDAFRDYRKSETFYQMAASRQDAESQYQLAMLYRTKLVSPENQALAIEWLKKAADNNHPDAMYALAQAYEQGDHVEKNNNLAFQWYLQAAYANHALAAYQVGNRYENGVGIKQSYKKAFDWYTKSAALNHPEAEYHLAKLYETGRGTERNYPKALYWYEKAADQNQGDALLRLAESYEKGILTAENKTIAHDWYCRAAAQEITYAQYQCGSWYIIGTGIDVNYDKGIPWLKQSAEKNYLPAQVLLGKVYASNNQYQNYAIARYWLSKAAKQGDAGSQYTLAQLFWHGRGGEQSFQEAARYLEMAANNGHVLAQSELGLAYQQGQGVPKNYKLAAQWYRKAAYHNNGKAQYNLSAMYFKGKGVEQDLLRAYSWAELAAQNGELDAKLARKRISHLLTQAEVDEAQALSQQLVKRD